MRWEDISLTRQEWRIPETKSGQSLVVPLASTPMKILKRRRKATGNSPWVFPSRSGSGHLASPRKTWLRLCERAKIKGLTIHDLRRSFASWQVATGASETVIGKSLGHAAGSRATSVYARANLDAVRRSAEAATTAMQAAAKKGGGR